MAASLLLRLEEELGRQFGVHDVSTHCCDGYRRRKQELRRILDELSAQAQSMIVSRINTSGRIFPMILAWTAHLFSGCGETMAQAVFRKPVWRVAGLSPVVL
jgi:hypothetical protein